VAGRQLGRSIPTGQTGSILHRRNESILAGGFLFYFNDGCHLFFGMGQETVRLELEMSAGF
jgi:hypothetical protein